MYAIRHGKTDDNARGIYSGRSCISLNEVGRRETYRKGVRKFLEVLRARYEKPYYIPLNVKVIRGKMAYEPTTFDVKTLEKYQILEAEGKYTARIVVEK